MLEKLILIALLCTALFSPLLLTGLRQWRGKTARCALCTNLAAFAASFALVFLLSLGSAAAAGEPTAAVALDGTEKGLSYIGAALAVGLSGIGGGIAVASAASAALGAISENDNAFGKALIFVGLAEGVALYGLIIAIMILFG
jgi:ATP synthase subunit C.